MQSDGVAIRVEEVTKSYRIGLGRARVREMLPPPLDRAVRRLFPVWWAKDTFNALEDVSCTVYTGSSVGIVGHNGAGKTTLLKAIAGVTAPTSGGVRVSGRVAALLDAVVGFHPDLTGQENAYLLGAVHGFGRRSMKSRLKQVFDFAEIHELADTPLKRYSTGMIARLGFATVTALDPDILLVDELLAVGDAEFQRKCIRWLEDYREQGGTLLFVSHNLGLVRSMTQRIIWLHHGKMVAEGSTNKVLAEYGRAMERRDGQLTTPRMRMVDKATNMGGLVRWGAGGARVEEVSVSEPSSNNPWLEVAIRYQSDRVDEALFCIGFMDEGDREIGAATSPPVPLEGGSGAVRCVIKPLPLRTGIYFPVVAIVTQDGLVRDRWKLDRAVVVDRDGEVLVTDFGPVEIASEWSRV